MELQTVLDSPRCATRTGRVEAPALYTARDETRVARAHLGLSPPAQSSFRRELPLLPDLFNVRRGSHSDAWRVARHMAHVEAHPQVSSVAPGRRRSGPATGGTALALGSGLVALRNRGQPMVSLRNSFPSLRVGWHVRRAAKRTRGRGLRCFAAAVRPAMWWDRRTRCAA